MIRLSAIFGVLAAILGFGCSNHEKLLSEADWSRLMDSADSAMQADDPLAACRFAHDAIGALPDSALAADSVLIARFLRASGYCRRAMENDYRLEICSTMVSAVEELSGDCAPLLKGLVHAEMASILYFLRRYDESTDAYLLADSLIRANSDSDSLLLGATQTAAVLELKRGNLQKAEGLSRWKVVRDEFYFGPGHYNVASSSMLLATVLTNQGRLTEASALYDRVFHILSALPDQKSKDLLLSCLRNLANIRIRQGRFWEAEELELRALAQIRESVGEDDPEYRSSLAQLGCIYSAIGAWDRAEPVLLAALRGLQETRGERDWSIVPALEPLSELYGNRGRFVEAESLLCIYDTLAESTFGTDSPSKAVALNRFTRLYLPQGRFDEADSTIQLSLANRRQHPRPNSLGMGFTFALEAAVRSAKGHNQIADSLYSRSLGILRNFFPDWHPSVTNAQRNFGIFLVRSGRYAEALAYFDKSIAARQSFARYGFSWSSERQKLDWTRRHPVVLSSFLTAAVQLDEPSWTKSAFNVLLNSKGKIIDNVMAERRAAFCASDPQVSQLLEEQKEISNCVATLALAGLGGREPQELQDSLTELCGVYDDLDRRLSGICSEIGDNDRTRALSYDELVSALPESMAVCEIYKYSPHDFTYPGGDFASPRKAPRYLALVLNSHQNCSVLDLGEAKIIDRLVDSALGLMEQAQAHVYSDLLKYDESLLIEVTSELYKTVFEPIASRLDGDTSLYICPDGALNLLPFEIFTAADKSYLVEHYQISYLNCARDLIDQTSRQSIRTGPVAIFADPDFDYSASEALDEADTRGHSSLNSCFPDGFLRLPHTRTESETIASLFGRDREQPLRLMSGRMATEGNLKHLEEVPYVLHIATHGFVCPDVGSPRGYSGVGALLSSGLALTGANRVLEYALDFESVSEDGIVTALEISGLDLHGTALVVLSACRTGSGETVDGEGVFGLRRAFQIAGAGSLLLSTWDVPDEQTSQFMSDFYRRWLSGEEKVAAARNAMLERLNDAREQDGHGHPLFWAGFVFIDDGR